HFHLLGIAQPGTTDEITRTVFDEFHELSAENAVGDAIHYLSEVRPDVIYYPSVGMFPLTVYLTALRLAPLQLMALGHPATTWSEHIDGVLVEEDYLGDPACFSETICAVPKDAIPYIPPASTERVLPERTPFRERAKAAWPSALPVRVAVCASVMKINPGFLDTLREISDRSRVPVQFCFYMGFAQGLTLDYLRRTIRQVLPTAEVNA
ncbi:cobalt ABC transporter permease, partial [Escherichia coli]